MKRIQENLLWHKPQTLAGGGGGAFHKKSPNMGPIFYKNIPKHGLVFLKFPKIADVWKLWKIGLHFKKSP